MFWAEVLFSGNHSRDAAWDQLLLGRFTSSYEALLFDDPLSRVPGTSPKVRLHDTIEWRNHHKVSYLIPFKGDETGTRLSWEHR